MNCWYSLFSLGGRGQYSYRILTYVCSPKFVELSSFVAVERGEKQSLDIVWSNVCSSKLYYRNIYAHAHLYEQQKVQWAELSNVCRRRRLCLLFFLLVEYKYKCR